MRVTLSVSLFLCFEIDAISHETKMRVYVYMCMNQ